VQEIHGIIRERGKITIMYGERAVVIDRKDHGTYERTDRAINEIGAVCERELREQGAAVPETESERMRRELYVRIIKAGGI